MVPEQYDLRQEYRVAGVRRIDDTGRIRRSRYVAQDSPA